MKPENEKKENQGNLEIITARLQDFLTDEESKNLALTGDWGTGKSQAWKRAVYHVREASSVSPEKDGRAWARERYSYVSAADCESIEDLKGKILASTKESKLAGKLDTVKSFAEAIGSFVEGGTEQKGGVFATILGM
ncbi:hypothetical protein FAI40_03830 [Acetobacteraceae bacterium]|nr:hypothetical protein FAI40_03830 [Acetobacteraceae bacterium]